MLTINNNGHSSVLEERQSAVALRPLALVQDDFHSHTAIVGRLQGFTDRCAGEAVRLHENRGPGGIHFGHNRSFGSTPRAEVDAD